VTAIVAANDGDPVVAFLISGAVAFLLTFVLAKQQSR
jgi:hypothetical protein